MRAHDASKIRPESEIRIILSNEIQERIRHFDTGLGGDSKMRITRELRDVAIYEDHLTERITMFSIKGRLPMKSIFRGSFWLVACTLFAPLAGLTQSSRAFADGPTSTVRLNPQGVSIALGETRSFRLPRPAVMQRIFIQAEAWGYGDAAAEVWVNGDKKGDIYVPRTDPNYTVTIGGEYTESVEIIAVPVPGGQGNLTIHAITAVVSEMSPDGPDSGEPGFPSTYRSVIGNISNQAIRLVDQLESYTNYQQYGMYLLPIKKAAVLALSRAEAYGDASVNTRPSALSLLETLDFAEQYMDDMFERDRAFDLSRQLLGLRENVRRVLY